MQGFRFPFLVAFVAAAMVSMVPGREHKEFLTPKEIEKIQDVQEIDGRVKIYMDAAEQRLKTAEERLGGKEPEEGDPFEFFTPEDLVYGYHEIIKSVTLNIDGAIQTPRVGKDKIRKALKTLKDSSESSSRELAVLKRIAEEKKKEELWDLVQQAIEITQEAREGAENALAGMKDAPDQKTKSR
jgi:hypothetical protein